MISKNAGFISIIQLIKRKDSFFVKHRMLFFLTALGFLLRFIAYLFLSDWFYDGFTWIFYSKTIHEDPFFTTGHNRIFLPLFAYIGAIFLLITNFFNIALIKSLQLLNLILGTLTVSFTYVTAKRATDDSRIPNLSGLLIATNPVHVIYSVSSLTEILFGLFLLLTVFFFIDMNNHRYSLFLSGFCFSLACITRYESWALIPLFIPFFYIKRHEIGERWIQIIGAACIGLLGVSLWFLREAVVFGNPWIPLEHYLSGKGIAGGIESSSNLLVNVFHFPGNLIKISMAIGFFSLFIYPILIITLKSIRNSALDTIYFLFASFIFVLSLSRVLGGNSGWDRYLLPILPQTIIIGTLSIVIVVDFIIEKIQLNYSYVFINKSTLSSLILGVVMILYLLMGGLTVTIYLHTFNLDRYHEPVEAGHYLASIYSEGTIICDLKSVHLASELGDSNFYGSYDFFEQETVGSIKERFQSRDVRFVVWTNARYPVLEEYLPFLNSTTPKEVEYQGITFTMIFRSDRNTQSLLADIFEIGYPN